MKIKHFVITRFLCDGGLGFYEKIFDENIISFGLELLTNYFIPSLKNQTNKNFEIIFLINDKHNIEGNINKLNNVNIDVPTHIIRKSKLKEFILDKTEDCDFYITSRMDYDDLCINTIILLIQNKIKNMSSLPLKITGFKNGLTYVEGDENIHLYNKYSYSDIGFFSVMETLIINKHLINEPLTIYDMGEHTKVKNKLIDECKRLSIKYDELMFDKTEEMTNNFVWVRHKYTGSEFLSYSKPRHYLSEIININNFNKLYGINIQKKTE